MANSYQNLIVWQKSVDLAVLIYKLTAKFPKSELYSLVMQMRRAVVSIASNIAEGQGRQSIKEFRHFIKMALGSLFELETQIIIAYKVGYVDEKIEQKILNNGAEIKHMLFALKKSLFKDTLNS